MTTSRKPDIHDQKSGRELAQLRKAFGFSQERLAEQLGISVRQYRKYERGQSRIPLVRFETAMQILREHPNFPGGFAEVQAPYSVSPVGKDFLLKKLRGLQDEVKLSIDVVERL